MKEQTMMMLLLVFMRCMSSDFLLHIYRHFSLVLSLFFPLLLVFLGTRVLRPTFIVTLSWCKVSITKLLSCCIHINKGYFPKFCSVYIACVYTQLLHFKMFSCFYKDLSAQGYLINFDFIWWGKCKGSSYHERPIKPLSPFSTSSSTLFLLC